LEYEDEAIAARFVGHYDGVNDLAWSRDRRMLAFGSGDRTPPLFSKLAATDDCQTIGNFGFRRGV
jgi:hypothetical protein